MKSNWKNVARWDFVSIDDRSSASFKLLRIGFLCIIQYQCMNFKTIIQVIKCLTLGLLCPLTPFYYSSVENRGCKSSLTHWRFGNPLESWRKVCNQFNHHLFSFHIASRKTSDAEIRIPEATSSPIPVTDISQCGFIIQFYFFELWWTTNFPMFQFNLFLFASFSHLIWLRINSRKTQLPFNSLLIFTGGELKRLFCSQF